MRRNVMRNLRRNYTINKFLLFWGAIIIGALLYEYISDGLPNDFDTISSDLLYAAFGFGLICISVKKLPKMDFAVGRKYEVIKISQYGNRTYGPYETYAEAELAIENFEENFSDESFYEIKTLESEQ